MSPFEYALLFSWMILVLWVVISALVRAFLFPGLDKEEQLKLLSEEGERLEFKYPQQVCE